MKKSSYLAMLVAVLALTTGCTEGPIGLQETNEALAQASAAVSAVPAEVVVSRPDAATYSFSSQATTQICKFRRPILLGSVIQGPNRSFTSIGVVQGDGTVLVDRSSLLSRLGTVDVKFVFFITDCGSNFGDFGAKALLNRIKSLAIGESVTIATLYLIFP